jgi:hypothetical protein
MSAWALLDGGEPKQHDMLENSKQEWMARFNLEWFDLVGWKCRSESRRLRH